MIREGRAPQTEKEREALDRLSFQPKLGSVDNDKVKSLENNGRFHNV